MRAPHDAPGVVEDDGDEIDPPDTALVLARAAGLRGVHVKGRFPSRLILTWSPEDAGVTAPG